MDGMRATHRVRHEFHFPMVALHVLSVRKLREHSSACAHAVGGECVPLPNQRIEECALQSCFTVHAPPTCVYACLQLLKLTWG